MEEETPKIQDTTGTVFIQGPSIVLPVWRCIMFNGSYLRACMKLRIVQKNRFSLHESGWTKAWSPGLGINNKPSTSCHWYLWFGTRLRHQTRAPWLGPPRLKKAKSNFFTNHNILHTLKNKPLNIMLLHTSRRMDGLWIKTVPVVSHIFDVSSSTGR